MIPIIIFIYFDIDNFFHILLNIYSDILSDILSDISSGIQSDIFLSYIF